MTDDDKAQDRRLANHVVSGGRLRALVLELWQRTRIDWGFVTDRLSTTFRKETWIGSHDRRFIAETLYGLVRHVRRVDTALTAGGRKSPRDLDRLLAFLVLDSLIDPRDAAKVEPAIDWNAVRGIDAALAGERDPVRRLALTCSLPDWIAARLVADHGADAEPLARGLNERAPMTVRANTLKVDRAQLAAALAAEKLATTPGRWCPTALHVDTRTNLFGTAAFKRGELEAQDEGSQLLAELAVPTAPRRSAGRPGIGTEAPAAPSQVHAAGKGIVVDLCAGAGGKTLAIAAAMGNRGRVVATDIDGGKLEELRRRARRAGVTSAQAVAIASTGDRPPPLASVAGKADVVLVDAPCSGLGSLRRNPEARWRLREADLADFARRQREILGSAIDLAAPGGVIIYATCTVLRAENEDVVAAVMATCSTVSATPFSAYQSDRAAALGCSEHLVVTPHRHGTDAFFAAILTRAGARQGPGTGRADHPAGDRNS